MMGMGFCGCVVLKPDIYATVIRDIYVNGNGTRSGRESFSLFIPLYLAKQLYEVLV